MQINFQTLNIFRLNKKPTIQQNHIAKNQPLTTNPFAPLEKDIVQISFGSDRCSTQNFEVKNIENLHCPACGLIMLTDRQINSFADKVCNLKGEELALALEKYEDESVVTKKEARDKNNCSIYRPIKQRVVNIIKNTARENPDLYLTDIVKKQAQECIEDLIAQQFIVFGEIENYIKQNIKSETERDTLLKSLENYKRQAKGETEQNFARKIFINDFKAKVTNSRQRQAIEKIACKLPTSENDVNSFFVKYAKKDKVNSKLIAQRLVHTAQPTAEHLIPKSKGGGNKISNYICDCAECNSRRSNTDFYDWAQSLPDFEKKLQAYIYDVQDAIDNEYLSPRYDTYTEQIVDTIATISEGEITLEIPDSKNPKKVAAVIQKRGNDLEKIKAQQSRLEERKGKLEEEIRQLEKYKDFDETDEYREIQEELERIVQESVKINDALIELRKPLYRLKAELKELEAKIESTQNLDEKKRTQKEFNTKQNEYLLKQKQYDSLETQFGKLKRKKIRLKKQKKTFLSKENKLRQDIETTQALLNTIQQVQDRLKALGNVAQKEQDLLQKIATTEKTMTELKAQIEEIEAKEDFNPKDRKEYNDYLHKKDLLFAAETLLKSKDYKKLGISAGKTRELIELSKETLDKEIEELFQKDGIAYFANLSNLKAEMENKEQLEKKLEEIVELRKQADSLNEEIAQLCAGKTPEKIEKELQDLLEEKRTIQEIFKIGDKRKRLEHLTKTIKRNNIYIRKLENYQDLTSAQWSEMLSFIDLEDANQF